MAGGTLGTAYVQVMPSMKGFRKTISAEMGSAGNDAAGKLNSVLGKAGKTAGASLGGSLKNAADTAMGGISTSTFKTLEANVAKTQAAFDRANRRAADDAGKVRVAQEKLNEVRAKGNATASQIAAAEERLAAAERKAAESAAIASAKQQALASAQASLKQATDAATASSEKQGLSLRAIASTVGSGVSTAFSKLGGLARDTFSTMASGALAVGGAIASGIVANMGNAIKRVDTLNNYPKVMTNLGFDDAESKASIEAMIAYFDSGLPGSLDQMASSVQKFAPIMQGMGKSLTETTTFTTALNNALLAGGKGTEGAARGMEQYSQMLATGKVDLQSWKILQEVMPGQLNQVAKAMLGAEANASGLYKALQSGEVSLSDMNDAIVKLDSEGLDGFASFSQQAQDATMGIGTALDKIKVGFTKAGASILTAIGPERISNALGKVKTIIESVGAGIGNAISTVMSGGFGDVFTGLAPAIGAAAGAMGPLLSQLPVVGKLFTKLTGPVGLVIGLFVSMWQNSADLRDAVKELAGSFAPFSKTMSGSLKPVLTQISQLFSKVAEVLGGVLAVVIRNVVMPLIPALARIIQNAADGFNRFLTAMRPVAVFLGATLVPAIKGVISAFGAVVSAVVNAIASMTSVIRGGVSAIFGLFSSLKSGIVSTMLGLVGSLASVGVNIMNGLRNGISSGIGAVVGALSGIAGRVRGALAGAGSWLVSVGRNIVDGIVSGIKARIGAVASSITSGLSSAVSKARKFLEINSPSKLMAREVGAPIGEGVAYGVEREAPDMMNRIEAALGGVENLSYTVPTYGATNTPNLSAAGSSAGGGRVVNQTINVQAIDPASVASVIAARERVALGA